VREGMSGNLCRCGAYRGITEAVLGSADHGSDRARGSSMNRFDYIRPATVPEAVAAAAHREAPIWRRDQPVDLMKGGIISRSG
jgi:xanthine dehydrogenase iron-sulfur cluster and FAD-binding subunit A